MTIINQRMADDRKEFFIKKNKIINELKESTIKSTIIKIFEDKKGKNIYSKNKNVQLDLQNSKYIMINDTGNY